LTHVLWIGGATDSGKTSVARALAATYGLQAYFYDEYDREAPPGHWSRADPRRQPHMAATPTRDRDWMWVRTTPEALLARWLETTPERFGLALEDLAALPVAPPVVAEGYGFVPDLVAPLIAAPRQAIWLVSTEAFKRQSYARRDKGRFADTSDPQRARRNHFARDLLIAAHIRERAAALGLTVLTIDGSRPLDEIVSLVAAHLVPFLPAAAGTAPGGGGG
jgi:hypothetical protein